MCDALIVMMFESLASVQKIFGWGQSIKVGCQQFWSLCSCCWCIGTGLRYRLCCLILLCWVSFFLVTFKISEKANSWEKFWSLCPSQVTCLCNIALQSPVWEGSCCWVPKFWSSGCNVHWDRTSMSMLHDSAFWSFIPLVTLKTSEKAKSWGQLLADLVYITSLCSITLQSPIWEGSCCWAPSMCSSLCIVRWDGTSMQAMLPSFALISLTPLSYVLRHPRGQ